MQNILDKQTHLSHPFIYCQVKEKTDYDICEQHKNGLIRSNSHLQFGLFVQHLVAHFAK